MAGDAYAYRRAQMVDALTREGISNQRVLEAMAEIPRHYFVPEAFRHPRLGLVDAHVMYKKLAS